MRHPSPHDTLTQAHPVPTLREAVLRGFGLGSEIARLGLEVLELHFNSGLVLCFEVFGHPETYEMLDEPGPKVS